MTFEFQLHALLIFWLYLMKPPFYYISGGLMRSFSHGDVSMMEKTNRWIFTLTAFRATHPIGCRWNRYSRYRKFPKYSDTQKIRCKHSKILTMWLYHRVMGPNDADGMANSVDPDQTAPLIWVCPGLSVRNLRIITVIVFIDIAILFERNIDWCYASDGSYVFK